MPTPYTATDALAELRALASTGAPHVVNLDTIDRLLVKVEQPANPPLPAPLDLTGVLAVATFHVLQHDEGAQALDFAPQLARAWAALPADTQRCLRTVIMPHLAWDANQLAANRANPRIKYPEVTDLGGRDTRRAWDQVVQAWEGHPLPPLPTPEAVRIEALMEALDEWQQDDISPDYDYEPTPESALAFLTLLGQMGYSIVATSSLPAKEVAPC